LEPLDSDEDYDRLVFGVKFIVVLNLLIIIPLSLRFILAVVRDPDFPRIVSELWRRCQLRVFGERAIRKRQRRSGGTGRGAAAGAGAPVADEGRDR
jgi:hypothetical protein